jgi:very-short-patch-repair endonuclease
MVDKEPPLDVKLAELARRQHGVVAVRQLVALGLTRQAVSKRARAGRLHRVFRGVYAVGHRRLTRRGVWMAAVLACGEGAVLSHLSAADLYGLRGSGNTVDVTSPTRSRHSRRGIRLHHPRTFQPGHRTAVEQIPVTTVPRLLADLAPVLDAHGLKRAWQEAQRLRLLDVAAVKPFLTEPRRGIGRLTALVEEAEDAPNTRTELEHLFHDFVLERRLPRPHYNAPLHGRVVDALWAEERVIVELDSRGFHWHRAEEDFDRDAELLATHGYVTYRVTWRALTRTPGDVARRLRRLLRRAASPPRAARAAGA